MYKISIIVPVFNAERYLQRCIDSVLSQSYENWELILVDDGSIDGSFDICQRYAVGDLRIKCYHKNNGGVSSARNLGLRKVTGDWVTFVDADDWMASNTLELCSQYFDRYDIVRFSFQYVFSLTNHERNTAYVLSPCNDYDTILANVLARNSLLGVWGGFYKCSLFEGVKFCTDLVMGEDWLVLVELLVKSHKVIEISDILYSYNQLNENSCSNTPSIRKTENCLLAIQRIKTIIPTSEPMGKTLSLGHCVIMKAMLRALLIHTSNSHEFLNEFLRIKKKYGYPSLTDVVNYQGRYIEKITLLLGLSNLGCFFLSILSYVIKSK